VLALAATDAVGLVLFGTLYAAAGAGLIPSTPFRLCLVLLFGLVTALWVRAEARHRALGALARIGRAALGLVVVVLAAPVVVLMPIFWLDAQLPEEAGLRPVVGGIMTVVLVALALVALVNALGGLVAGVRALARAGRGAPGW